ncbi:hypothetical protein ACHAXS_003310 [Conticribra weissflogii]
MNARIFRFFYLSRSSNNTISILSLRIDLQRFLAVCASFLVVWCIYVAAGVVTGVISALLTGICTSSLFSYPAEDLESEVGDLASSRTDSANVDESAPNNGDNTVDGSVEELQSRGNHISNSQRYCHLLHELFDQAAAICIDDVDELLYVGQVLSENRGILVLLVGGIVSMMMAILAGLDDVNVFKAFYLSTCCYGITTLLVAKSARRAGHQQADSMNATLILTNDDIKSVMRTIPREKFVHEQEMHKCKVPCLEEMIQHRRNNFKIADIYGSGEQRKQELLMTLRRLRNFNESCCICLSTFENGDYIRILPGCRHEFHDGCINQWAHTFACNDRRYYGQNRGKPGRPTCPLCNAHFGNIPPKKLSLRY